MKTTNQRFGRKDAATQPPAVPTPNKDETHDAYVARCEGLKVTKDAAEAEWKKLHPENPPVQAPAAPAAADDNTITADQLQAIVQKAVKDVADENKAPTPIGEEGLRKLISDEIAKLDSKKLTVEQVEAIAKASATAVLEHTRKAAKNVRSGGDADRGQVEIPCSWRKGNLPVHAKQLLNIMMGRPQDQGIDSADLRKADELGEKMIDSYQAKARRGEKALTSTTQYSGDELVPTSLSAELQRRFYLSSDLAALFAATEIDMPTQPYEYPLKTTRATYLLETTEGTDTTGSSPGTGLITLDAKKLMGKVNYSYEVDEDAIVPILNMVQTDLSEAAAETWESVIINGDTTSTHMDTDTQLVSKAPERAAKGFRKLALAGSCSTSLASGGLNEANLRAMKKTMGKYAMKVADLIWICGPNGYNDLQAITNVATLEKYGPKATILTGELTSLFGIPIIASEKCREDLANTGVNGASGNTYGSILLVNKSMFLTGRRRAFTVETFRDVKTQTTDVVASFRKAFVPKETPAAATMPILWIGYAYSAA